MGSGDDVDWRIANRIREGAAAAADKALERVRATPRDQLATELYSAALELEQLRERNAKLRERLHETEEALHDADKKLVQIVSSVSRVCRNIRETDSGWRASVYMARVMDAMSEVEKKK